jgi:type I restriction enzyme, S subunit
VSPPSKEPGLPDGWRSLPLRDVASEKIVYGIVQAGPHDPNGVPYLKSSDVGGRIAPEGLQRTSLAIHAKFGRSKVVPGNIVISLRGNTGATSVVPPDLREANLTQGTARIAVSKEHSSEFVRQQIAGASTQRLINAATKGSTFVEITLDDLRKVEILCPPLHEQRRIADILSTWDEAIETVEALVANAREQKRALMQTLLTGHTRLPGFADDWSWTKFSDAFNRVRDKNDVGDTNVLTISAQHGLVSQTDYFNKVVASDDVRGYTLLRLGDFAYNKSYSDGYPLGAFKPLERYDRGIVSSLYICFRLASANYDHDFMRHYFEAGMFNREVAAIAQEGARNHGLLNVSVVDFFDTSLHTPGRDEQVAIAAVINNAERAEQMLINQCDALRKEKASLMQQLLTGKRRVELTEGEAA